MLIKAFDRLALYRHGLVEPRSASTVPDYSEAFAGCDRFSRSVVRDTPDLTLLATTAPPERLAADIESALHESRAKAHHMAGSAGQCLKFSHFFAPYLEKRIGLKAWPTIGQLWKGTRRLFGPDSWSELRTLLKYGVQPEDLSRNNRNGLHWHAWITLQTGELIDLTFASSLARAVPEHFRHLEGTIAWGREPEVFSGHRYFPMLAGAPAIETLQSKSCMPFLADSIEDLATVSAVFVRSPHA